MKTSFYSITVISLFLIQLIGSSFAIQINQNDVQIRENLNINTIQSISSNIIKRQDDSDSDDFADQTGQDDIDYDEELDSESNDESQESQDISSDDSESDDSSENQEVSSDDSESDESVSDGDDSMDEDNSLQVDDIPSSSSMSTASLQISSSSSSYIISSTVITKTSSANIGSNSNQSNGALKMNKDLIISTGVAFLMTVSMGIIAAF